MSTRFAAHNSFSGSGSQYTSVVVESTPLRPSPSHGSARPSPSHGSARPSPSHGSARPSPSHGSVRPRPRPSQITRGGGGGRPRAPATLQ